LLLIAEIGAAFNGSRTGAQLFDGVGLVDEYPEVGFSSARTAPLTPPLTEETMVERIRPKPKFEVGYARPPKATQFKAGKSGNARGRPKGARGIGAILSQLLRQKIVVTENGRKRRVGRVEVIMLRLVNDALLGDPRALKFLFPLIERYLESPEGGQHLEEMLAEDQAILATFLKKRVGTSRN
jgi:hypothetical protein